MSTNLRSCLHPVKPLILGLLIISGASAAPLGVEPQWTTYQGNASHTGYVPVSLTPQSFSLRWRNMIGGRLNPVAAADARVFVSQYTYFDDSDGLWALDAATGKTLWKKTFGRVFSINPPSYDDGKVYIQNGKGSTAPPPTLHALTPNAGIAIFESTFSAQWERYYAPTHFDGNVYVNGGRHGGAYAFDGMYGNRLWFNGSLPSYDQWTPAVDELYVYAYVGENSPGLYVLDRATGNQAFKIADPNFDWHTWSMDLAPVLGGKDDVLAIHDGRLISFDLADRDIRWELTGGFAGQCSLAEGVIYAIQSGDLTARDESTGDLLWSWGPPSGTLIGTMVVTDTHLFTRTADAIYAVDLASHDQAWSYPASGHLALSEGVLYAACDSGELLAFSVPEPSAVVLLLIGALSFVAYAWRGLKTA